MTTRIPTLTGALNFRDLGGYASEAGGKVRWNRLYRSGTTHAMTPDDIEVLRGVGIRYAYDLRSNGERRDHPNRLREIEYLEYGFREHDHLSGDIKRLLKSPGVRSEDAHELMRSFYRKLPFEFEEAYRALFGYLLEGKFPLVFNCTAGKDRTGVAAALVLTALGIPRDAVLEDYLLTEAFFDKSCEIILNDKRASLFLNMDRSIWEPLMRVHRDYLDAMFSELEESHGSVQGYLEKTLGLDAARLATLRSHLLE